jgi:hypothetical protein
MFDVDIKKSMAELTDQQKEYFNIYVESVREIKKCLNPLERERLENDILLAKSKLLKSLPFSDFVELMKASSFLIL